MESSPKNPILEISNEQLESLRRFYEINDVSEIQENIKAIKDWMKKETHLNEASVYMNDIIIERMYYLAKGSLEATKTRIDKFLTTKYLMPDLCKNRSMDEFDGILKTIDYIIMPKLNPKDLSRVCVMRFLTDNLEHYNMLSCLRYIFMLEDYIQNYDFNLGLTLIVDYKNVPLSILMKLNPIIIKKAEILYTKGYSLRVKGIYFLNAPNFMDKVLTLLRSALSEKVAGRMKVYQTCEGLHEDVPKEILPQEYGGYEPPCAQIAENQNQAFSSEEGQKIIVNAEKMMSDETKRISSEFNVEYLGMPGSFRNLNVD